ncbi:hypothetical protein E2320_021267 [Naja naja]|nr:hypothetical protein E2320_021267 [Naja naja]
METQIIFLGMYPIMLSGWLVDDDFMAPRVFIEYQTAHIHYHVEKLVGVEYSVPSVAEEPLYRYRIPRVSTQDTDSPIPAMLLNLTHSPICNSYSIRRYSEITHGCETCHHASSTSSIFSRNNGSANSQLSEH